MLGPGRHALGWDIAVTGDLSSIWINRIEGDVGTLAALITLHDCDRIAAQRKVVSAIMESAYDCVGAGDKSGLGRESVGELELAYPDRFAGVIFGRESKLALGALMSETYEQRFQVIPADHAEIAADLACVRKSATAAGKLAYVETKNEVLPESHADICWSNALALYAGKNLLGYGPARFEAAGADETEKSWRDSRYPDHSDD